MKHLFSLCGALLLTANLLATPVAGVLDFSATDSASLVWNLPMQPNALKNDTAPIQTASTPSPSAQ